MTCEYFTEYHTGVYDILSHQEVASTLEILMRNMDSMEIWGYYNCVLNILGHILQCEGLIVVSCPPHLQEEDTSAGRSQIPPLRIPPISATECCWLGVKAEKGSTASLDRTQNKELCFLVPIRS